MSCKEKTLAKYEQIATEEGETIGNLILDDCILHERTCLPAECFFYFAFVAVTILATFVVIVAQQGGRLPGNRSVAGNSPPQGDLAADTAHLGSANLSSATVRIPFDIAPNKKFGIKISRDARRFFPNYDIFIKSIAFVGVEVDSKMIPFHTEAYFDEEETHFRDDVLYSFHHTLLHQGLQQSGQNSALQFHTNGGIAYGTHPHTTSFGKYGLRLRPDTKIYHCQHSLNLSNETKIFTSIWNIDFLPMNDPMIAKKSAETILRSSPSMSIRPLITGWFHVYLPKGTEVNNHVTITRRILATRGVYFVGVVYHHHPWMFNIQAFDKENRLLWEHDETPSNDGSIDFFSEPLDLAEGEFIDFIMQGKATFEGDLSTPAALSFYVELKDGSDRVEDKEHNFYEILEVNGDNDSE